MPVITDIDARADAAHAARLSDARSKIEQRIAGIQVRASRQMLRVARAVVHVRSGRLRDGLAILGPFTVGEGVLESQVGAPSVPYAGEEAARGGAHDFPQRTLEEGAGIIDQMARDIEVAIIEETGAGAS